MKQRVAVSTKESRKTILVVDDEPIICRFVAALLIAQSYTVLTAEDADDALRISREHEGPIDLLLSNIQMPGISGIELAAKINIERPEVKVMLMSGFQSGMLILNEGWHFLHKPFVPSQLLSLITNIMGHPPVPDLNEHR